MMATLKAEFKKLLTIRSTYIISGLALALTIFITFYVEGFKNAHTENFQSFVLGSSIVHIASIISVFCALIGLLLVAHEYRYNTIVYTFTASNNRSKVLASKIIAVIVYVFFLSLILASLGLVLITAGAAASGHHLPHQDISYITYLAKVVFFSECFGLTGMLFAALIRNQVGAIAALFIIPNTLEGLLSLLLKHNSVYMPFTALQQVVQAPVPPGVPVSKDVASIGSLSPVKGMLVFLGYFAAAWIVTWYLFLKRDAN